MAADRLRAAATLLRERAEAATPGPWFVEEDDWDVHVLANDPHIQIPYGVARDLGDRDGDAAYIAAMHPLVGLAVAGWLDTIAGEAASNEEFDGLDPYQTIAGYADALAVADLILGGA